MSKIAFISDIHGNYPALLSVLRDIDARGISEIYCLGDLVGYYCQINEVINEIRNRNIQCVIGNHDYALVHNAGVIDRSRTCTNVLTKHLEYIDATNYRFLESLSDNVLIEVGNNKIMAVHGGLNNYVDEYLTELSDEYFANVDKSITHIVTAHNHKAMAAEFGKIHYANSGSVGQPRDNNPQASYVIYDNGDFHIVRVSYPIDETIERMKEFGFPDYIAEVLKRGCKIGD